LIFPGHGAFECKNPRKVDRSHIPDVPAEQAWAELTAASAERDLDDMKEALMKYIKATPDATYLDLEKAFRTQDFNLYIIALEKELAMTYTNMDLQGNLEKKYSVSWRMSSKHSRPKEKDLWPASPEENLERLLDAGEPVDRGIPKCTNCDQLGHTSKSCPDEKQENGDRAAVKCFNCDQVGHRVRDCKSSPCCIYFGSQLIFKALTHARIGLHAAIASSLATQARNALSLVLQRVSNAKSAMRVSASPFPLLQQTLADFLFSWSLLS
jgi:hypothetical protein